MNILVTGATGLIGSQLCMRLANEGYQVHALYRSAAKTKDLDHPGIRLFEGDILDPDSLNKAVAGCQAVFHLAAFARVWDKDPQTFRRINVQGTSNVLQAARDAGVKRVVLTSTAGVYGPSVDGVINEQTKRTIPFFTAYEETKAEAETLALNASNGYPEVVIVNPTRVYGPGLLSESNGVTRLLKLYAEGRFGIIPGNGKSIGNYVFIDDVVDGHLLAFKHGRPNENYLLGGDNVSFNEFFSCVASVTGKQKPMIRVPEKLLMAVAFLFELRTVVFRVAPLITREWVTRYLYHWDVSSQKAVTELGYKITPLEEGLNKTCDWLNS
ncbi:SDR family oxidoreductase [Gaoshiqia sp. Z1-71]|uniref:SDR family oxidoreductase n=1 Tax=Gaoshiqia hydrogeniformans TaxID=3290090 RepID=UPI003BF80050